MSTHPGANGTTNRLSVLLIWITLLAVATYYSVMPSSRLGDVPGSDKVWHLGGYGLLALPVPFLWNSRRWILLVAGLLAAYGVLLEFVQHFVPGRSFELADILANSAGVLLGTLGGAFFRSLLTTQSWKVAAK